MKNLTLSIKQIYFDQILSGEKNSEYRVIRPNNVGRYCQLDSNGDVIDIDGAIQPVKYDTITFYTGAYSGKRPKMVVAVKDAEVYLIEDENGELVKFEENGLEYYAAEIEYHLGEILEKP
jgi:hypothetical protein